MQKTIAMLLATLVAATVLVGIALVPSPHSGDVARAQALSGSSFQPGNIISDAAFYDGDAMSAAQIQTFLTSQVATCRSSSCLVNGRFAVSAHGADAMCAAVAAGSGLSAAALIARVATACGISPRVVLVTLQKEQSLVTATDPSATALAHAMGYACPDTGSGCDPAYSGLGNQVYWSAWQWKRYGNPAGTSAYFTWFAPGAAHAVQYAPSVSCGTKSVTVQNKATAALYYYTPYTPNQAALGNLYGTGDACSTYGNRNFWRIYSDWFGSPTGTPTTAIGSLDGVTAGYGSVAVRGWGMDRTTTASTTVTVTVDGTPTTLPATTSRPDVGAAYPGQGSAHGFDAAVTAQPGVRSVCVAALAADRASSKDLGCRTVTVLDGSPSGAVDTLQAAPGGVSAVGWALDPETTAPIGVAAIVDGTLLTTLTASVPRSDVARVHPASGAAHGFAAALRVGPGVHTVCLTARNTGTGADRALGTCRTVTVIGSTPVGRLDAVTTTTNSVTVRGWAIDGDVTTAIPVDVTIDGTRVGRLTAAGTRSDLTAVYPGYGAPHGYTATYPARTGTHIVCATAVNVGAGTTSPQVGCKTVTVTNAAPVGRLDAATAGTRSIQVSGWAWDADTTAAVAVQLAVDGRVTTVTANGSRPDVARVYPAAGASRGYTATITAGAGSHRVCATAVDASGGLGTAFVCRTATVG